MLKVFACEYGISSGAVTNLMRQLCEFPQDYVGIEFSTGNHWYVRKGYEHLAEYVEGMAQHTGMDYSKIGTIEYEGETYAVDMDLLDTDGDGDIKVYLVAYELGEE